MHQFSEQEEALIQKAYQRLRSVIKRRQKRY